MALGSSRDDNHVGKGDVYRKPLSGLPARRVVPVKRHFGDRPSRSYQHSDLTGQPTNQPKC